MVRLIQIENSIIDVDVLLSSKDLGNMASAARYHGNHQYELTFVGGLVTHEDWKPASYKTLLQSWVR